MKKKKKIKEEEKKKGGAAAEQKKRVKKVYDLPGQKRDRPEEVCCCFHVLVHLEFVAAEA